MGRERSRGNKREREGGRNGDGEREREREREGERERISKIMHVRNKQPLHLTIIIQKSLYLICSF